MADPKGIAFITGGAPSPVEDEEDDELSDDPTKGMKSAKVMTAGRVREAIDAGDDEALSRALEDHYKACKVGGGPMMAEEDSEEDSEEEYS